MNIFEERCKKAQKLMAAENIDFLFVSPGTDMRYLTNYICNPAERLRLFILPIEGESSFITPAFEAPRFKLGEIETFFEIIPWEETEDPIDYVASIVDPNKPVVVAIDDRQWSVFTIHYLKKLSKANFVHAKPVLGEMRMRKDEAEIEFLRETGRRVDKVWEDVLQLRFSGFNEIEIGEQVAEIQRKHFASPAKYQNVFAPCWGGPNSASPHGGGDPTRVFQPSDGVDCNLYGGSYMGYKVDKDRCAQVEPATDKYRKVYEIVQKAQQTAFEAVRPGMTCESIDAIGRQVITKAGYGDYFTHRIGHGLGLDGHEDPYIVEGNKLKLEPGMVFSIEPGIYLPGQFGIRIQDIVVVTEDGAETFYYSSKDFHVVK